MSLMLISQIVSLYSGNNHGSESLKFSIFIMNRLISNNANTIQEYIQKKHAQPLFWGKRSTLLK